jgi:hypothetical protein
MYKFSNFTKTLLATAITAVDTVINVSTGSGTNFPTLSEGERFKLVLVNTSNGDEEVVEVTGISSDALTAERAKEGTTAKAFPINTVVFLARTADVENSVYRGHRNHIRNGGFWFWDLGTTFASPVTTTLVAPGWKVITSGTVGTFSVSRQAITPGVAGFVGTPTYAIRWDQTVASAAAAVLSVTQRVENAATIANRTVTVSFWAKNNSGSAALTVSAQQNFGTGGAPSTAVDVAAAAPTMPLALTSAWKRYSVRIALPSVSGKTFGSAGDSYLAIIFKFADAVTGQNEITEVQLEDSPIATPFELRNLATERAICSRYYWITFPDGTAPAQNAGATGSMTCVVPIAAGDWGLRVQFPVQMRATPTITLYNPSAANNNWRSGAADPNSTQFGANNFHVTIRGTNTGAQAAGDTAIIHASFNAEL